MAFRRFATAVLLLFVSSVLAEEKSHIIFAPLANEQFTDEQAAHLWLQSLKQMRAIDCCTNIIIFSGDSLE